MEHGVSCADTLQDGKQAQGRSIRGPGSVDPFFQGMHWDPEIVRHGGLRQSEVSLPCFQIDRGHRVGFQGFGVKGKPGPFDGSGFVGELVRGLLFAVLACHKFGAFISEDPSVRLDRHRLLFPYRILPDRCSVPPPVSRFQWWQFHD